MRKGIIFVHVLSWQRNQRENELDDRGVERDVRLTMYTEPTKGKVLSLHQVRVAETEHVSFVFLHFFPHILLK